MKCCFCNLTFKGTAKYIVPEGFPTDKRHEGKPLCEACGSHETPTLDTICAKLDREQRDKDRRRTTFRGGITVPPRTGA